MDQKSLELLEFPAVRERLAAFTTFIPGREMALKILPLNDYNRVLLLLKQSEEARRLLTLEHGFSIGDVFDIREAVKLAAIGKILEPQSLLEISDTLSSLISLRRRISERLEDLPTLWNIAEGITELPDIQKEIENTFDPEGEVRDSASPKLEQVRQQLKKVRAQLLEQLQSIISSSRWEKALQEPIVTEREGRYVVPVKVEFRHEVRGIIHDVSNTGATAFIEPYSTIDAGNTLRELEAEEKYEVERILRELSGRVGIYSREIARSLELTAEIDLAMAKAKYARRANAIEPVVVPFQSDTSDQSDMSDTVRPRPVLKLIDARHPLLPVDAVPLSVEIGKDFSILVITGPNTGGKTVALKTIGILSLMAQSGLPIPAAKGTIIPFYDNVFADIGDEQSIAQTLSTFSWHVTNLVRIVSHLTDRSIVLLDELGTSTDPSEGSALARSLLSYILKHGAMGVATTHFSELKAFAHSTPGLQNSSLDFDAVTLKPTYHLTIGIPGGSNALATATRLGLSPEIVEKAREMLSPGSQEMEKLLSDVVVEKQQVLDTKKILEREREELQKRNRRLEEELEKLRSEEKHILSEARDRVVQESADLFRQIREASLELRKDKSKEKIEQARRAMAAVQEKMKSGSFASPVAEQTQGEKVEVGDTVWLKEANVAGTVLAFFGDDQKVEIRIGQARVKVGIDSIEKTTGTQRPELESVTYTPSPAKRKVSMELDLRGKRAEEIKDLVDQYLNEAAVANLPRVRIIHGYGTGVVRQIVRELLSRHTLVKSYKPGERNEGGDGVSIANLK